MLTPETIERLAEFEGKDSRVLSVYLDLDPSTRVRGTYRIAFEDLVKDARILQEAAAQPQFADEVARVQTFLETEPPRGKGLVVFTCAPAVLWQAEFLAVRAPNHLVFEPKPDLAPLLRSRFPKLTISWTEGRTADLVRELNAAALDGILVALEAGLGDVDTAVLGRDPFVLAAAPRHALVSRTTLARPDLLQGHTVLLLDEGHCFRDQVLQVCAEYGA